MKKLLFVTAALLLVIAACRTKKEVINYPISAGVQNYYDYKEGSYWIFKDSASGDVDSLVVTKYELRPAVVASVESSYDQIDIFISDYKSSGKLDSTLSFRINLVKSQADIYLEVKNKPSLSYLIGTYPFVTFPPGQVAICGDTTYSATSLYPQLALLGNTYDSVYDVWHKNRVDGCNTVARNDDFFVNRTAGLVKMRLHNYVNRVWELQRFHINR